MDESKLSENQQDYINKIHQVVADGLSLIRNLVDYRNLEYRKREIILEQIDLSQLVLSAVKRVKTLAEKKELVFHCDIEPDLIITSDNSFVNRAIDNVLSNAIKFSTNAKAIEVSLKRENGHNFIKIKDEAGGLTEEDMRNLFHKFQKLSCKPTAGESTTGLGLYITKSMLNRIGGKIQCVTKEGEGSTFIIDLPSQLPG
jgi:signal transduction histidine kinase